MAHHCSMKLGKTQRWKGAKDKLEKKGAKGVQFSLIPDGKLGKYAWAYRYTTKSDTDAYHSPNHPSLERISANRRQTQSVSRAKAAKRVIEQLVQDTDTQGGKKQKLNKGDVCTYIREKNIRTLDELLADAETRRLDGDETLSRYVFASNAKSLSEQIDLVWRMAASVQKVKSLRTPRMEKLVSASLKPCEDGCNDLWLRSAYNLLERNGVSILEFADIPVCGTCFSKMCLLGYNQ